jgi:hypothetical protein
MNSLTGMYKGIDEDYASKSIRNACVCNRKWCDCVSVSDYVLYWGLHVML